MELKNIFQQVKSDGFVQDQACTKDAWTAQSVNAPRKALEKKLPGLASGGQTEDKTYKDGDIAHRKDGDYRRISAGNWVPVKKNGAGSGQQQPGAEVKVKVDGGRPGKIVGIRGDVATVEMPAQGDKPARTEQYYLSDLEENKQPGLKEQFNQAKGAAPAQEELGKFYTKFNSPDEAEYIGRDTFPEGGYTIFEMPSGGYKVLETNRKTADLMKNAGYKVHLEVKSGEKQEDAKKREAAIMSEKGLRDIFNDMKNNGLENFTPEQIKKEYSLSRGDANKVHEMLHPKASSKPAGSKIDDVVKRINEKLPENLRYSTYQDPDKIASDYDLSPEEAEHSKKNSVPAAAHTDTRSQEERDAWARMNGSKNEADMEKSRQEAEEFNRRYNAGEIDEHGNELKKPAAPKPTGWDREQQLYRTDDQTEVRIGKGKLNQGGFGSDTTGYVKRGDKYYKVDMLAGDFMSAKPATKEEFESVKPDYGYSERSHKEAARLARNYEKEHGTGDAAPTLSSIFEEVKNGRPVEDKRYQIGEISQVTGLKKTATGWVKPNAGGKTAAGSSNSKVPEGMSPDEALMRGLIPAPRSAKPSEEKSEPAAAPAGSMKSFESKNIKDFKDFMKTKGLRLYVSGPGEAGNTSTKESYSDDRNLHTVTVNYDDATGKITKVEEKTRTLKLPEVKGNSVRGVDKLMSQAGYKAAGWDDENHISKWLDENDKPVNIHFGRWGEADKVTRDAAPSLKSIFEEVKK